MTIGADINFFVHTTFDTDGFAFDAIEAGTKGYFPKDQSPDHLFRALRAAARGKSAPHALRQTQDGWRPLTNPPRRFPCFRDSGR